MSLTASCNKATLKMDNIWVLTEWHTAAQQPEWLKNENFKVHWWELFICCQKIKKKSYACSNAEDKVQLSLECIHLKRSAPGNCSNCYSPVLWTDYLSTVGIIIIGVLIIRLQIIQNTCITWFKVTFKSQSPKMHIFHLNNSKSSLIWIELTIPLDSKLSRFKWIVSLIDISFLTSNFTGRQPKQVQELHAPPLQQCTVHLIVRLLNKHLFLLLYWSKRNAKIPLSSMV